MRCLTKSASTFLSIIALGLTSTGPTRCAYAQDTAPEPDYGEPVEVVVEAARSANQEPAGAITTFISGFRYDPQVDLQDRNLAETQSDATIRGGIFENTSVSVGAATIYDPQTGHYTAELPIPPSFLSPATVLTGANNALAGFNATAGAIATGFKRAETQQSSRFGLGDYRTNIQELTSDNADLLDTDLGQLSFGANFSHSSSNGTRKDGDSEFFRYAARAQLSNGERNQTDLLFGYQKKDFRWPYLYALQELHELVGSTGVESESLETSLIMLNHRNKFSDTGHVEATAYYRRNHDDYEFDFYNRDLFNPFRHTTEVYGAGVQALEYFGGTYVGANGQIYGDQIDSTALTFGNYDSRTLAKISTYVGHPVELSETYVIDPYVGVSWDKSDRTAEHVAPIARVSLKQECETSERGVYAEYSGTSQLPGYTALNSNPDGGLFRGNKSLKRQETANSEVGYQYQTQDYFFNAAFFFRKDDDLTDWTYSSTIQPFAARSANNVDVETQGIEVYGAYDTGAATLAWSYAYLNKHALYEVEGVDSSFYALNYPGSRAIGSLISKPREDVEVRADLEFRNQYQNQLRASDDTTYIISSVSAYYEIPGVSNLSVGAIVDNIGNEHFEEVPGVPGSGRLASLVLTYGW